MIDRQATVLVVDDNQTNRDVLSRRIERYGHTAETASNGREALNLIRSREYDLVLLDIMMPQMNGFEVLKRLKEDPLLRHLPVIVISALDDIESIVECINLGAEDYLTKPFNPMLLRARITACLDKKLLRDKEQEYLEEQAVAQRIDRELNAQLDLKRTSELTLEWALRRSQVAAALLGFITAEGLEVSASQGFESVLPYYENNLIPLNTEPIQKAIRSILPQSSTVSEEFLLPHTQKQVIMPIGRGGQVFALFILESENPSVFDNATLAFLTRLCDRAGISLANAQLYAAIQNANKFKSEFVQDVSHELKNPMTAILNYAKMISSAGPINEAQALYIETIINNVNRMTNIVSDLSEASKIEAGQLPLAIASIDLAETIHEVVMTLQTQVDAKEQSLKLRLAEDLPRVWADRQRLGQIIMNLLSNAHKYTPVGGTIILTAERAQAEQLSTMAEMVHVAIEDTGIGLRAEDQTKIFKPYFRAADSAQGTPGTGLGLNITKKLVELQGGRIWFESEHHKGTTFHFLLPTCPPNS